MRARLKAPRPSRLVALALAAGCSTSTADGPTVSSVEIVGNQEVDEDAIASGLVTRGPTGLIVRKRSPYDPLAVDADVDRIESFYAYRGYYSAEVTDVDVDRTGEDQVEVRFRVREGEPTRIADLELGGVSPEEVRPLQEGEILRYEEYEEVKQRLRRRLVRRGYLHAEVEGRIAVDREERRARVQIEVDSGPLVRFGETEVTGLDEVPESAVFGRLAWEPGDRMTPEKVETTRGRLYQLGVFRSVRIDVEREGRPAVSDVTIEVSEGPGREVRLGAGVAADNVYWEIRGRAGYRIYGFLHPLTELVLDATPAYRLLRGEGGNGGFGGEARADLTRHDLFLPRLSGTARLGYRRLELEAYTSQGPEARLFAGRPFFQDRLQLSAGWELEYLQFFNVHPSLREELSGRQRIGFFDQTAALDLRDDLLDPRRGAYFELRLEEGTQAAGGEFDYLRGLAEARGYVPIGPRVVAAARARTGRTLYGDLPVSQRFYSGGATAHRGFAQRQLAPFGRAPEEGQVPIGGEELVDGSVEVRFDVVRLFDRWLGGVLFLDGGDVVLDEELDYTDLHWAVGAGLRYHTIVGPVRFDFGYRLNRTGPGEPAPGDDFAFHISLGQAF